MTNITINTKNTKKRGNGMKKILAILLAIITVFAMSIPAFAADETAKDVDNTFDNYTPAPEKTAPENWYDPYCYDEDGHINKYCLNQNPGSTYYCPEHKKIFTNSEMGRYEEYNPLQKRNDVVRYRPYQALCENWTYKYKDTTYYHDSYYQPYCPYCGKYEDANYTEYSSDDSYNDDCFSFSHLKVENVYYGWFCPKCGDFNISDCIASNYSSNVFQFNEDYHPFMGTCCGYETGYWPNGNELELYRFLTEEQRNAEYSFIFEETADQFAGGKDYNFEDVKEGDGTEAKWNSPDNPNYKPSFWQKIVNFFASIAAWFQKIFGIVK